MLDYYYLMENLTSFKLFTNILNEINLIQKIRKVNFIKFNYFFF